MRLAIALLMCLSLAPLKAQTVPTAKETQNRLHLIATRATAYFQSAESVEESLRASGNTLHPSLIAMRMRIEAALNNAQNDLKNGEVKEANEQLDRAQVWVDRFARRFGGE